MTFQRLYPDSGSMSAEDVAAGFVGSERSDRPYVATNFAMTADGRIAVGGRSGPIGNEADKELTEAKILPKPGKFPGVEAETTDPDPIPLSIEDGHTIRIEFTQASHAHEARGMHQVCDVLIKPDQRHRIRSHPVIPAGGGHQTAGLHQR